MNKMLMLKFVGQKAFYPLEMKIKHLCAGQNVTVWAIFNCSRNLQLDPEQEQIISKDYPDLKHFGTNAFISHAVPLGKEIDQNREFADQIALSFQSFLNSGNGKFELSGSLQQIHESILNSSSTAAFPQPVFVHGKMQTFEYKGDTHNGKKHGHGTARYPEGRVYTGDWIEDKMHGYGTITFSSGNTYSGEFQNDKKDG